MRNLNSNTGSTILQGLVGLALVGVLAASVPQLLKHFANRRKVTRAQTMLIHAQSEVASVLSNPENYLNNCVPNDCEFNPVLAAADADGEYKQILNPLPVLGVNPSDDTKASGIRIASITGTEATATEIVAQIEFNNLDVPMKGTELRIPKPIAQSASVLCPASQPIFQGFNAAGSAKCTAVASNKLKCNPGQIAIGFDWANMQAMCRTIANTKVSCSAADEVIDKITGWQATSSTVTPTVSCKARIDPWPLTPAPTISDLRVCVGSACSSTTTTVTVTPGTPTTTPPTTTPPTATPPPPPKEVCDGKNVRGRDNKYKRLDGWACPSDKCEPCVKCGSKDSVVKKNKTTEANSYTFYEKARKKGYPLFVWKNYYGPGRNGGGAGLFPDGPTLDFTCNLKGYRKVKGNPAAYTRTWGSPKDNTSMSWNNSTKTMSKRNGVAQWASGVKCIEELDDQCKRDLSWVFEK